MRVDEVFTLPTLQQTQDNSLKQQLKDLKIKKKRVSLQKQRERIAASQRELVKLQDKKI